MLFDALAEDAFRPLTGKYRQAYAFLLRELRDGLFSVDVTDQPTRAEVLRELADSLDTYARALPGAEAEEFRLTAGDAYAELRDSGWLEEQREGWAVYVEMDAAHARLLETLCGLRDPGADSFGGTMVSVLSNLETARADPGTSAQGVQEAARRAKEFARHMRTVVGTLKGVEKSLLEQASVNGLVRTFFEEFVDRVVIGDYRRLTSARGHPYGFKWRIRDLTEELGSDHETLERMAETLVSLGVARDRSAALGSLHRALQEIRASMDSIQAFRERIDRTKSGIEQRFANTLAYAGFSEPDRSDRFGTALAALGARVGRRPGETETELPLGLIEPPETFDAASLAAPTAPRRTVEPVRFRLPRPDPLREAFERAKSEFDRRLSVTPERFMGYVADKLGGRGRVSGRDIPPGDVEELVILSALRAMPAQRVPLPDGVAMISRPGTIENDWIIMGDFELVREGAAAATEPVPPPPRVARAAPSRSGANKETRRARGA